MHESNPIESVRRAARNSPWLVMSILFHVILLIALGLVVLRRERTEERKEGPIVVSQRPAESPPTPIDLPVPIDRSAVPPDRHVEIVDPNTLIYVPSDLAPPEVDLSKPIGDPSSTDLLAKELPSSSSAIGVGIGQIRGPGVTAITNPNPFNIRVPPGEGGGGDVRNPTGQPKIIDKAVREGLIWLCRHQNPDGSWGARSMRDRCDAASPCFDEKLLANDHYDEGLTSLALLAFLGAGFTHQSDADLVDSDHAKRYRLGEVVKKGLEWLRARQNPDGSFSRDRAFMYNEALATMALSEAFGMTRRRYWKEPAQRGVDFLEAAQRPNPNGDGPWGWRYASRGDVEDFRKGTGDDAYQKELFDSDTSVTAWCVMALKSAQLSGLRVAQTSMDGAHRFSEFVTANDGLVGYLDAKGAGLPVTGPFSDRFTYHTTSMSALGMCIRIFARHDSNDAFLDLAARRIVADLPTVSKDGSSIDYYYWYYASLALNQLDGPDSPRKTGKYWNPWNRAMVEALLGLQDQTERACTRGGWIRSDRWGSYSGAGPLYDTALNVLTLEVYYRYPNAFGAKRN